MGRRRALLYRYVVTPFLYLCLLGVVGFFLLFLWGVWTLSPVAIICGIVFCWWCGYFVFRDTLGIVQGVGPIYWLVKPLHFNEFRFGTSHMYETDYPWREGKGLCLHLFKRSFHVGVCHRRKVKDEEDGLLDTLGGRFMDTDAHEIGDW